jgi:serine phosphatase RsbU (regulator of sigma subunit)
MRLAKTSGKEKADVLLNLAKSVYKKDPATAKKYLDELEPLAKSLNYEWAIAAGIAYNGRIDLNKKDYENALTKFKDSKDRAIGLKDVKLITENYTMMGALYEETSRLNELDGVLEALQLYKNSKEGQEATARVTKSKAFYYYFKLNYKGAKEEFRKAADIFKKLNDQAAYVGTAMNVGVLEYKLGEIKESMITLEASMNDAKKLRDTLLIADYLTNLGLSEFALGNIDKSIELQEQANKLYLLINNTNRYQSGILNVSSNLMNVGKHNLALKYLLSALDNSRKNNDPQLIVLCYRTLSDLHLHNNDTAKALQYLNDGLEITKKEKLVREEASFLRGLGQLETYRAHYDLALNYLTKSETLYTSINIPREIDAVYTALGNVYLKKKEYAKAEEYYLKSLEIGKKMGVKNSIAGNYSNLGVIYYEQGDYDKSIGYYMQALEIRKQINNPYMIADSYLTLSNSYYHKKEYEKSYDYYKKYHLLLDSAGNVSSKKEIADMQTKYETKDKEQQITMLSKDQKLKTLLLDQNKKELLNQELLNNNKRREIELLNKDKVINENNLNVSRMAQSQKEKELVIANKDKLINEEEANRQKQVRYLFTGGFVITLVLALFILRSYVHKRRDNAIISEQKKAVDHQNHLIRHQKKEIMDSINYAQRIQQAILPFRGDITIKDFFILYKPKDIVSGDFYFYKSTPNGYLLAVADCTGHGVPGAFMSLIGSKDLKEITEKTFEPGKILSRLNIAVKQTLKQNTEDATRDGMDIVMVHVSGNRVTYAGANRALWYIDAQNELIEVKATKHAIGGLTDNDQEFEEHVLDLQKGDMVYLSSDGFADQFGGDKGKKLTTKKMKEELRKISYKPMAEQEAYLGSTIETWRGNIEQLDDICVIGIRI